MLGLSRNPGREQWPIDGKGCILFGGATRRRAFTLIELLVVMSIIALLMSILVPVLGKGRRQARRMLSISNQRMIVRSINVYAADNDGRYPDSIATVGYGSNWGWQEPMKVAGYVSRFGPRANRSMSAYLRSYMESGKTLHCPLSPRRPKNLEEAWQAGEAWDNPDTPRNIDPVTATYCFLWGYTGYLEGKPYLFGGPRRDLGGRDQSRLAVCCYFGYDYYSSPNAYGSCERFKGAGAVKETQLLPSYWADETRTYWRKPQIKLQATYIDGHAESYSSTDTVTMRVIFDPKTGEPYPHNTGPGQFYLPENALH